MGNLILIMAVAALFLWLYHAADDE